VKTGCKLISSSWSVDHTSVQVDLGDELVFEDDTEYEKLETSILMNDSATLRSLNLISREHLDTKDLILRETNKNSLSLYLALISLAIIMILIPWNIFLLYRIFKHDRGACNSIG